MKDFLREYWAWILAPLVLVLGLFVFVIVTQETDETSVFTYKIFDG